jgi:predicted nucleic acid-binding protein
VQELEIGVLLAERRDPSQGAIFRTWFEVHVLPAFAGRILPVDAAVAKRSAALHVPNPCSSSDSLIAATALVHKMTLVTRNVADFQASGVPLVLLVLLCFADQLRDEAQFMQRDVKGRDTKAFP